MNTVIVLDRLQAMVMVLYMLAMVVILVMVVVSMQRTMKQHILGDGKLYNEWYSQ